MDRNREEFSSDAPVLRRSATVCTRLQPWRPLIDYQIRLSFLIHPRPQPGTGVHPVDDDHHPRLSSDRATLLPGRCGQYSMVLCTVHATVFLSSLFLSPSLPLASSSRPLPICTPPSTPSLPLALSLSHLPPPLPSCDVQYKPGIGLSRPPELASSNWASLSPSAPPTSDIDMLDTCLLAPPKLCTALHSAPCTLHRMPHMPCYTLHLQYSSTSSCTSPPYKAEVTPTACTATRSLTVAQAPADHPA